jgi:cation:H+ antiporter
MVWIMSLVGLVILLLSGDLLVRGAVNLSLRLGVPALIVSLTIVAFGTSAPELLIAISAVDDGASGIAIGNVIGSNIANVLLVLGMPALLSTLDFSECDTRRDFYIMLGATVVFIALAATGQFGWWQGVILLIMLAGFLGSAVWRANCQTGASLTDDDDLEGLDPELPMWKVLGFLLLGLIGLPMGADILVDNAVYIARAYGISEEIIGLTLIAIGTSLPELATTVMAGLRNQAEVVLGNVIGSNIFNLLGIIGVTTLFDKIYVSSSFFALDIWVMLASALVLIPFVFLKWRMSRTIGALFLGAYTLYLASMM